MPLSASQAARPPPAMVQRAEAMRASSASIALAVVTYSLESSSGPRISPPGPTRYASPIRLTAREHASPDAPSPCQTSRSCPLWADQETLSHVHPRSPPWRCSMYSPGTS